MLLVLNYYIEFSFNGYPVALTFNTYKAESTGKYIVRYGIDAVYVGEKEVNGDVGFMLLKQMSDALSTSDDSLKLEFVEGEEGEVYPFYLLFDLENAIPNEIKVAVDDDHKLDFVESGSSNDDGLLKLVFVEA